MANMKLGTYTFDVNPKSFEWGYNIGTHTDETYSGRVVQILSLNMSDVSFSGSIIPKKTDKNQYEAIKRFENDITNLMQWQVDNKMPLELSFPEMQYQGSVYITNLNGIKYDNTTSVVQYTITCNIDTGFEDLVNTIKNSTAKTILDSTTEGVQYQKNSIYSQPGDTDADAAINAYKQSMKDGGTTNTPKDYIDALLNSSQTHAENGVAQYEQGNLVAGDNDFLTAGSEFLGGIVGALLYNLGLSVLKNESYNRYADVEYK